MVWPTLTNWGGSQQRGADDATSALRQPLVEPELVEGTNPAAFITGTSGKRAGDVEEGSSQAISSAALLQQVHELNRWMRIVACSLGLVAFITALCVLTTIGLAWRPLLVNLAAPAATQAAAGSAMTATNAAAQGAASDPASAEAMAALSYEGIMDELYMGLYNYDADSADPEYYDVYGYMDDSLYESMYALSPAEYDEYVQRIADINDRLDTEAAAAAAAFVQEEAVEEAASRMAEYYADASDRESAALLSAYQSYDAPYTESYSYNTGASYDIVTDEDFTYDYYADGFDSARAIISDSAQAIVDEPTTDLEALVEICGMAQNDAQGVADASALAEDMVMQLAGYISARDSERVIDIIDVVIGVVSQVDEVAAQALSRTAECVMSVRDLVHADSSSPMLQSAETAFVQAQTSAYMASLALSDSVEARDRVMEWIADPTGAASANATALVGASNADDDSQLDSGAKGAAALAAQAGPYTAGAAEGQELELDMVGLGGAAAQQLPAGTQQLLGAVEQMRVTSNNLASASDAAVAFITNVIWMVESKK